MAGRDIMLIDLCLGLVLIVDDEVIVNSISVVNSASLFNSISPESLQVCTFLSLNY